MGSHKTKTPDTPAVKEPDPAPTVVSVDGPEAQAAEDAEKRRSRRGLTRQKTILAGDTSQEGAGRRTILGG